MALAVLAFSKSEAMKTLISMRWQNKMYFSDSPLNRSHLTSAPRPRKRYIYRSLCKKQTSFNIKVSTKGGQQNEKISLLYRRLHCFSNCLSVTWTNARLTILRTTCGSRFTLLHKMYIGIWKNYEYDSCISRCP